MARKFRGVGDLGLNFDINDENLTMHNLAIHELMYLLKYRFRDSDFAQVESILREREKKLKQELETTEKANEWLKEKLEYDRMGKHNELEECKSRCSDLEELVSELREKKDITCDGERMSGAEDPSEKLLNKLKRTREEVKTTISDLRSKIFQLECDKRNAEREAAVWKMKFQQMEPRLAKMLEDYQTEVKTIKLLEANYNSLQRAEPNVRVSGEDAKDVNEVSHKDAIDSKENVDLATADVAPACEGGGRPPLGNIIEIVDSDDDCAPWEILSRNETTSQRVANSAFPGQTAAKDGNGMLKRKQNSCVVCANVKESSLTGGSKVEKLQKLVHECDVGSSINHCSRGAVSSGSNNAEKDLTPSSLEPVILRQCGKQMGPEHTSRNLTSQFCFNEPGYDNKDSSSSSSSSSDSDDEVDLNFDFSQLTGKRYDNKWKSEEDMHAAFEKDNELYLKAVCALYGQQASVWKSPWSSSSSYNGGFNQSNAIRCTTLAKFLIDGDPQGKPKKSVVELLKHDKNGLDDCKRIAIEYSKQLFEIYRKKEDLFRP